MNEEFIKAWSKFLQSIKVEDDCTDKKNEEERHRIRKIRCQISCKIFTRRME